MKCKACGYKYNEIDETKEECTIISDGEEKFIRLQDMIADAGTMNATAVKIYACPICGTVRMERW